jgi:ketosteroid isomerase-like protein
MTAALHSHEEKERQMTTVLTKETQIRGLIDEWAKAATRQGHGQGHVPLRAGRRSVAFDAIAALQFKGAEAYRKHYEACFAMCSGPTTFEIHDLDITARDDVAFGHYLLHCGGTGPDGKEHSG